MIVNGTDIYIFGAHSRGQTLAMYLRKIAPHLHLNGFLYNDEEINPQLIDGIQVFRIGEGNDNKLNSQALVYLGIRGDGFETAIKSLLQAGFSEEKIIPITPDIDNELRNCFFKLYFAENGMQFRKMETDREIKEELGAADNTLKNERVKLYVIRSAFDKPLKKTYTSFPQEQEIQVGASLTESRLAKIGKYGDGVLVDSDGVNISEKNRQFCELTGLYWIWKHSQAEIVGLEHYRRHFLLPEDWIEQMEQAGADVILPTPLYIHPNLEENYRSRHVGEILDYSYGLLGEEATAVKAFMSKPVYSPCNMLIAKREVFDAYCNWAFPIYFAVAEHFGTLADAYQNRYPGFLSERLMSYFFTREGSPYIVMYADKNFLP